MAYTPLYNRSLVESAKYGIKLAKEYNKLEMAEIFEAWVTAGLAGLIDNIGIDATTQLIKDKIGDVAPTRSKPQLIVDNTVVELPSDCS